MRLIDAEKIKIPVDMLVNVSGCYMIRVEDMQRIVTEQPTAFNKEQVIEELKEEGCIIDDEVGNRTVEIIEKGGI